MRSQRPLVCAFTRRLSFLATAALVSLSGCGGNSGFTTPAPIILSVSLSNTTITVSQGSSVYIPVTIVAPTETATFSIIGLPGGLTQYYKESESNPSGLLTLTASAQAPVGTYMPVITVGSSGQTKSLMFTLVVSATTKAMSKVQIPSHDAAVFSWLIEQKQTYAMLSPHM